MSGIDSAHGDFAESYEFLMKGIQHLGYNYVYHSNADNRTASALFYLRDEIVLHESHIYRLGDTSEFMIYGLFSELNDNLRPGFKFIFGEVDLK